MSMQAYNQYMNLINQGMPYQQAYFESGLGDVAQQNQEIQRQQAEEQQRILASQQGRAGRQQLGGQLAGALVTKGAYNLATTGKLLGAAAKTAKVGTTLAKGLTAAKTGAVTAGTAGAGAGAVTGGAAAGAGTAGAGTAGAGAGVAAVAAPVLAAIIADHQARQGYKQGQGHDIEDALKKAKSDPMTYIVPTKALGMIAGSVFGGQRSKRTHFQMSQELLDMGYDPQDLQALGRMDEKGNLIFNQTTKAEQQEWKESTQSKDPNENVLRRPTNMWSAGGIMKTFGPEYVKTMSEFDRYVASAAAIQTDQIFSKRGELKVKDKDLVRQRYEELKNDPEQLAILENNYNNWLKTGKDTGINFDGTLQVAIQQPQEEGVQ